LAGADTGRPESVRRFDLTLECQGTQRTLRVPDAKATVLAWEGGCATVLIDGVQRQLTAQRDGSSLHLVEQGAVFSFAEASAYPATQTAADPGRARSPVAGVVAQVNVQPGDTVTAGQPLVCVEAMKMEMWLSAAAAGTVKAVHAVAKQSVAKGAVLVELEIAE
jgi:geranyl-CoA carboxylase alpha subunit